jgi:ribose 5-phosphate isomerase RpiB
VIGENLADEVVLAFLDARFSGAERHVRRLAKIEALESQEAGVENQDSAPDRAEDR